ncbi:MAG: hypothetical protein B6U89_04190 [Desulfurococcales archaeon ex4484_58]|nr:MAG: hypothetical protein B6U89_04190 [Desulfurococcales archaeon ex4484_58]
MNASFIITMFLLITSINTGSIYVDSIVALMPKGVSLNFNAFYTLIESYGYKLDDYIINESNIRLIVYKPWYDPYYIVVLGEMIGDRERVFIEIIRIGDVNNTYIVTSSRDHYTILYREISYLVDYGVLENTSDNLGKSIIYRGRIHNIVNLSSDFEEKIASMNIHERPQWETKLLHLIGAESYIKYLNRSAGNRYNTHSTYTGSSTMFVNVEPSYETETSPIQSENYFEETTKPLNLSSEGETSSVLYSSYEAMDKYYLLLISFLVASIFSLTVYYILKKHY